jgi:sugar lactone lactonase YvrE
MLKNNSNLKSIKILNPNPYKTMFTSKLLLFLAVCTIACSSCTKEKMVDTTITNTGHVDIIDAQALVSTANVLVTTVAGKLDDRGNAQDGNGSNARFWNPTKMVYDSRNNLLYIADGTVIRSMDRQNNVKTYVPLGAIGSSYNEILDMDVAPGTGGTLYIITKENDLWKITPNGTTGKATNIVNRIYGGNATGALNSGDHFDLPNGLATGAKGEIYFFNEAWNTMHRITLTGAKTGTVSTFAGKPLTVRGGNGNPYPYQNGQGETATFGSRVSDMATDTLGNIYVADLDNELLRKVTPTGNVTALFKYGNRISSDLDGPVSSATSNNVTQVSATKDGKMIFFATYGNAGNNLSALRIVRPGNDVTTLVGYGYSTQYGNGTGKTAGLAQIGGIAVTPDGRTIYLAEPGRKVIRKMTW